MGGDVRFEILDAISRFTDVGAGVKVAQGVETPSSVEEYLACKYRAVAGLAGHAELKRIIAGTEGNRDRAVKLGGGPADRRWNRSECCPRRARYPSAPRRGRSSRRPSRYRRPCRLRFRYCAEHRPIGARSSARRAPEDRQVLADRRISDRGRVRRAEMISDGKILRRRSRRRA